MIMKVYRQNEFENYKYVVVISHYNGELLLSRHRKRITWETAGRSYRE